MTEITKEKVVELIAGRIQDEFRKHGSGNVDWQKVAASKIYTQWFEHFQYELSEQKKLLKQKEKDLKKEINLYNELNQQFSDLEEEIEGVNNEKEHFRSLYLDLSVDFQNKKSRIKELEEALGNYDGIFNNPVSRRQNDTEIANECRKIGKHLLNKLGC